MLSRNFLTDMCRLSTMAYRDNGLISDLFENFHKSRPSTNEFSVLENCRTCPSLIHGDLTDEKDILQNDCQAYACRYQDSLAIVFRGTESFRDVLTDLNMIRVSMDLPNVADNDRPKVHWGFLRQFRTVEQDVKQHIDSYVNDCEGQGEGNGEGSTESVGEDVGVGPDVDPNDNGAGVGDISMTLDDIEEVTEETTNEESRSEAMEEEQEEHEEEESVVSEEQPLFHKTAPKKSTIKHIIFSGHSLGGALATLAAVQFSKQYPDIIISCVTFGSPRVGNGKFAAMFNKCCRGSYRFVNEDDPVPMGPTPLRFTHVKGGRWIDDEQLLLQKPWMRSLTFFKNLFLSFFGFTHNPLSDHGCVGYLNFITTMQL